MVSTQRFSSIQKLLMTAGHVETNEFEALNALRLATKMLGRDGRSFADLRLGSDEDDEDEDHTPRQSVTVTNLLKVIRDLEDGAKAQARTEARLTTEIATLKAQIGTLQSQLMQPESQDKTLRVSHRKATTMDSVAASVAAIPPTKSTPEEIAARREEKRDARIARARAERMPQTKTPSQKRGYVWESNPEVHRKVIDMYLSGSGKGAIAAAFADTEGGGPSVSSIFSITANGKPPSFLNAEVKKSGPIDWPEAWLIGSTLFAEKRSWLGPTLVALGVEAPSKGLSFDLNAHTNEGAVEELRWRYRETVKTSEAAE
ncbi:MAG: hypothetical protein EOP83_26065 [Verrucomicrobiaceae bacterium]|nr:MAG: hypothetical protein EOP83_26065 [Verrucomicrobiaceae bacterium]